MLRLTSVLADRLTAVDPEEQSGPSNDVGVTVPASPLPP